MNYGKLTKLIESCDIQSVCAELLQTPYNGSPTFRAWAKELGTEDLQVIRDCFFAWVLSAVKNGLLQDTRKTV